MPIDSLLQWDDFTCNTHRLKKSRPIASGSYADWCLLCPHYRLLQTMILLCLLGIQQGLGETLSFWEDFVYYNPCDFHVEIWSWQAGAEDLNLGTFCFYILERRNYAPPVKYLITWPGNFRHLEKMTIYTPLSEDWRDKLNFSLTWIGNLDLIWLMLILLASSHTQRIVLLPSFGLQKLHTSRSPQSSQSRY